MDGCLFFRDEIAQAAPPDSDAPGAQTRDGSQEDKREAESDTKRTKRVDTGKLLALYKAGWSQKKIAEELKVAPSTVCAYLKKIEEGKDHEKD